MSVAELCAAFVALKPMSFNHADRVDYDDLASLAGAETLTKAGALEDSRRLRATMRVVSPRDNFAVYHPLLQRVSSNSRPLVRMTVFSALVGRPLDRASRAGDRCM
jgi:hypothetical protein